MYTPTLCYRIKHYLFTFYSNDLIADAGSEKNSDIEVWRHFGFGDVFDSYNRILPVTVTVETVLLVNHKTKIKTLINT